MKIILIGSNGKIGTAILKKMQLKNTIFTPSRKEIDINSIISIKKYIKSVNADILINTAAYHNLLDCEINKYIAFKINVEANRNLLKACSENKIKYLTFSTDYVFDGKKKSLYKEHHKRNPIQVYGLTKEISEIDCEFMYPDNSIVIRTSGVFGDSSGNKTNFLLSRLKDSKSDKKIYISDEQTITPTFTDDLAEILSFLLNKVNIENGIYHITNSNFCSWYELATFFYKEMGIKKKIFPIDRQGIDLSGFKRPKFSGLSNDKVQKLIRQQIPTWKQSVSRYCRLIISG